MVALVLPTICLLFFVVGLAVYLRGERALSRSEQALRQALGARGLSIEGDLGHPEVPPGVTLGRGDGARVRQPETLALGATNRLTAPQLQGATVVFAPLLLPDLVVCERALAQAVFGAFPPSPVPTGDATFDARFGVFPAPNASSAQGADYRALGAALTRWATPEVLAALSATGFLALRTNGGRAEIAFAPTSPDGMALAIAATDAIGAAASGKPAPTPVRSRPVGLRAVQGKMLAFAFTAAMLIPLPGMVPRMALTFQDAHEDAWLTLGGNTAACPNGGRYSAGPGYRKQHRTHYCYETPTQKSPASEGRLALWTWGSSGLLSLGVLLVGRGLLSRARGKAYAEGAAALSA